MAASTVSISANTSVASRRRPVVSSEKKRTSIDLVNDGTASPLVDNNALSGGDNARGGGNSKDLSHSIRGEKVIERSKEFVQIRKVSDPISTNPPRRTRKSPPSNSKAWWQTALSVFTKNFVLLVCLAGLIQVFRKVAINFGGEGDGSVNLMGFSDMEGRIADVESYVKTTTKMLQVQLEVAEKKMEGEILGLRSDVDKKLDMKSEEIDSRLKELDEKSELLEKGLGQLTSKDLLSKEDFGKLYEEMKKSKIGDLGQTDLSLDEISALAKQVVGNAIDKHAADGLGRADYALATGGAMVVKHSEPFVVGKSGHWFAMARQGAHSDSEKMLRPSFGEPGQCFPLKGSSGFVDIKLRTAIIPEAITLEHVAKSVAFDRSSAPKDCQVYGWLQKAQVLPSLETESSLAAEHTLLTEFTYDLDKSNAQTFNVLDSASSTLVDTIRFDYTSNHGSASHTCIYRVRVHGHEPSSLSQLDLAY